MTMALMASLSIRLSSCDPLPLCRCAATESRRRIMKLSARNVLKGTVVKVTEGSVNDEVVVEVAPGLEVVAIVTKESVKNLGLRPGSSAYAVIKASSVIVAVD
jgi:molybdopterin-binding protein